MDYRYLRAFMTAAGELNFAKAAAQLKIAPSALSRQIALFEASVGSACFLRGKRGVRLTTFGEALYRRTAAYEESLEAAMSEAHAAPLRIGCLQSVFESLVADLIIAAGKVDASLRLTVEVGGPRQLQERLAAGQLDCAFNTLPLEAFDADRVMVEELVLVGRRRAEIQDPGRACWIIYAPLEYAWGRLFQQYEPNGIVRLNSLNAAVELVARGGGLTIVPNGPGLARHGFEVGTLPRRMRETIFLVAPKAPVPLPRFRKFQDVLRAELARRR